MKKKKRKEKIKKVCKNYFFFKAFPFIILICSIKVSIILCKKGIDIESLESMMVTDIIITLVPLIFTIISISLSLPSETMYGHTLMQIRKIRKDRHFEFKEMIFINILIFLLLTIFEIFNLTIQVWALDVVSLVYCIMFCCQEIPILTKDNNYVKKMIKKSGYLDENIKNNDFYENGSTSDGKTANDIIQAIILSDGKVSTFKSFKTKDNEKNVNLIDNLLSLQNTFLFKCVENEKYIITNSLSSYKGIDILKATEMALSNIESCICSSNDFNYIEIVKNTESYYQINRSIFNLYNLMDEFKLKVKFETYIKKIIKDAFNITYRKVSDNEKLFVYRIFNTIIIDTISNNEVWFIEYLRDAIFESQFYIKDIAYYYFITMYLFYVAEIEPKSTQNIKDSINRVVTENCNGLNSDITDSIISIFNFNSDCKNFDKLASILPKLLTIYDSCGEYYIWFQPPKLRSWSSNGKGFYKSFIIKNWLILLLTSSGFWHFNYDKLESIFESLNELNKKELINVLNNNFINDGKFNIKDDCLQYCKFYNAHIYLNQNEFSQEFFTKILNYVQDYNKKEITEEINKNLKTNDDYQNYKEILVSKFNDEAKKLDIYDSNLKINLNKKYCYNFLLFSEGGDQIVEAITNEYKNDFMKLLYDKVKQCNNLIEEVNNDNANEIVDLLIEKKYEYCNKGSFIFYDFNIEEEKLEEIGKIEHNNLWLPNNCFWNKKSIRINLVCDTENTIVRSLTRDEINRKIDEDFSQVDGLYKYNRFKNDNKSIFISREELIDIISKQYFYAIVVFSYEIFIDEKLFISLYRKDEKE